MVKWCFLGEVPYRPAWEIQRALWRSVTLEGGGDGWLLLLTHPPTLTLGRRESGRHIHLSRSELARRGVEVVHTDRGGLVTYHGPGQLVAYPIVHLDRLGLRSVPDYVSGLEAVMIGLCAGLGIEAGRAETSRGVWVGRDKIGAVGIHVARRVTTHGFAFNVAPKLEHYRWITPCGIAEGGITSLAELGVSSSLDELAPDAARLFGEVFGVQVENSPIFFRRFNETRNPASACFGRDPDALRLRRQEV